MKTVVRREGAARTAATAMELPESLPARLYLLACDRAKDRVVPRDRIGYVLRAAALVDLVLAGALTDDPQRPVATPASVTDGFEAGVHTEIAADKPRTWGRWVQRQYRPARAAVRDQLVAGGWIGVRRDRVLGLVPVEHVVVRDPAGHQAFLASTRELVLGTRPVSRVARRDAALVALAAAGELRTVLSRAERREYKRRIEDLTARTGPAASALRKVIRQVRMQQAAAASGGS
jgi:Golgi phosphoprotein 3 GPP34